MQAKLVGVHAMSVHLVLKGVETFVVASRRDRPGGELQLLLAGHLETGRRGGGRKGATPDWSFLSKLVQGLNPLPAIEVRNSLSPLERSFLVEHVLWRQSQEVAEGAINYDSVTEATAEYWQDLAGWGETSAARVLADAEGVSPRTIHSRLRLARDRGWLESPGQGKRQ